LLEASIDYLKGDIARVSVGRGLVDIVAIDGYRAERKPFDVQSVDHRPPTVGYRDSAIFDACHRYWRVCRPAVYLVVHSRVARFLGVKRYPVPLGLSSIHHELDVLLTWSSFLEPYHGP